jgi:hypothetical protein
MTAVAWSSRCFHRLSSQHPRQVLGHVLLQVGFASFLTPRLAMCATALAALRDEPATLRCSLPFLAPIRSMGSYLAGRLASSHRRARLPANFKFSSPPTMGVAAPVNRGGKAVELVAAQLFVPLSSSKPPLPGARFFLARACVTGALARPCRLGAPPYRAGACGRVASALFCLNHPRGKGLGELSMLPQDLYLTISPLGS